MLTGWLARACGFDDVTKQRSFHPTSGSVSDKQCTPVYPPPPPPPPPRVLDDAGDGGALPATTASEG